MDQSNPYHTDCLDYCEEKSSQREFSWWGIQDKGNAFRFVLNDEDVEDNGCLEIVRL